MKYPLRLFVSYSAVHMFNLLHSSTNQHLFKKYLCDNQGSHYENVDFDYTKETIMPKHQT